MGGTALGEGFLDLLHEPLGGELRLWDYRKSSKMGVSLSIHCLMIVRSAWPRDNYSGLTHSNEFC